MLGYRIATPCWRASCFDKQTIERVRAWLLKQKNSVFCPLIPDILVFKSNSWIDLCVFWVLNSTETFFFAKFTHLPSGKGSNMATSQNQQGYYCCHEKSNWAWTKSCYGICKFCKGWVCKYISFWAYYQPNCPWLVCSPDRKVYDFRAALDGSNPFGLLENKVVKEGGNWSKQCYVLDVWSHG